MAEVKAKRLDEVPYYQGANAVPGIRFHAVGRELGVTAWGMNALAIEAGCTGYPEHDHQKDGQEEVYLVLDGDGTLESDGGSIALAKGTFVRVGPSTRRKILPGPAGIVVVAIGATPGKAYAPR